MISSQSESVESGRPQAESLRIRLWSALFIALLFGAVSLLNSAVPGVNEPHYLTKARAFDDPQWCSRDFFLTSSNAHYCFFWGVGILTRWMSLEAIALAGRIVSVLILATGWAMLGRTLGLPAACRFVAAAIFAILSLLGSFSGEWLLGGFESKVPAWGLALIALSLWISGQRRTCPGWMTSAGVTCGLACSLHPVVGGWVAACICIASVVIWFRAAVIGRLHQTPQVTAGEVALTRKNGVVKKHLIKSFAGIVCFAVATLIFSLPGLIPALRLVLDDSIPKKDRELASFFQVFWRLKHHLDPTELPAANWRYALIVSIALTAGAITLRRQERRGDSSLRAGEVTAERLQTSSMSCLLLVFAMSALIALAGVLIGWHTVAAKNLDGWEWRAALLKFYPFRCFDALLPITAALVMGRLVQQFAAVLPERSSRRGVVIAGFICAGLTLVIAWESREEVPAGYTIEQFEDWRAACDWIRNHTPEEALFLTPRESFAFKWFAERAEFVCYKDCPQDAKGILTWNRRLWMLHDWTLKSSADLLYDARDLETLRKKTDCDFVITRILGPFETKPLWEGRTWKIYAVPELRSGQ